MPGLRKHVAVSLFSWAKSSLPGMHGAGADEGVAMLRGYCKHRIFWFTTEAVFRFKFSLRKPCDYCGQEWYEIREQLEAEARGWA